jgi:hypothetical protein
MKFASFIIALIIMLPLSVIGTMIPHAYYLILIITSLFIFLRNLYFHNFQFDLKSQLFLFAGFLSLIFNDIASYNNVWSRFGGFCLIMLAFGPLDKGEYSAKIKHNVFHCSKIIIVTLTILSLFAYILNLPFAFNRGISGVFNHSMVLSPMAALSAMICLDIILKQVSKISKFIFIILFCCSLAVSIIAGSRGAVLALIIGILAYLSCRYKKNKRKIISSISMMVISSWVIILYNPMSILDNLIHKMDRTTELMLSGRDKMWEDRITDFKSNPLIGVGFGTFKETDNSRIDLFEGTQESGSSWFLILGSMGLLGIITYLLLLFVPVIKAWTNNSDINLNIAIVFFFAVHTVIEGYSIAVGSTLCVIMWLNIGVLTSYTLRNKKS